MVCLMCLIPIFLIPFVNALPLLFYYLKGKIYGLLGWEFRKPERAPPACPFNPSARKDAVKVTDGTDFVHPDPTPKSAELSNSKED